MQQHKYGVLKMFIDLHGHISRMNTFLYGNALKEAAQVENILFAKLLSMNSLNFNYDDSSFAEENMAAVDWGDELSREGSSRVAIYKATSLANCYTIEASFHGSKRLNNLAPKYNKIKKCIEPEDTLTNRYSKFYEGKSAIYTPEIYEDMGRVILVLYFYRLFAIVFLTSLMKIQFREFTIVNIRPLKE